jgi:hypothetical protein
MMSLELNEPGSPAHVQEKLRWHRAGRTCACTLATQWSDGDRLLRTRTELALLPVSLSRLPDVEASVLRTSVSSVAI